MRRAARARASGSRWVAAFCVVAVSALIGAIPTQALPSRGHVFGSTFEGLGEHALKEADGIAVDEATGDVYVADRSAPHEQVERFKRNGAGGYEFVSAFAVKSPAGIAVDNSTSEADPSRGDVYVVGDEEEKGDSEEHNVLYKYDPSTAKLVYKKTIFKHSSEELELEEIYGVAVDASGTLWVYWGEEGFVSGFTDEESNRWEPSLDKFGFRVAERTECRARSGFAVAPNDEYFYIARERLTPTEECLEEETAPITVEKFGDTEHLIAARVATKTPPGSASIKKLTSTPTTQTASPRSRRAVRSSSGSDRAKSAALERWRWIRRTARCISPSRRREKSPFSPRRRRPRRLGQARLAALSSTSERLNTEIDPDGADTTYFFQYGTSSCVTEPSGCTDVPAAPGADVGSGFGDQP